ncbi:MAG: 50S ribosomal protein L22 [Bacilli bacterium]|nr:50S ribosomal protein L22 [Bacilli bacterium]
MATKKKTEVVAEEEVKAEATAEEAPKKAKKAKKEEKAPEKPAKPQPTEARATSMNVRCTPRKARLVLDLVRGKDVKVALGILKNVNRAASEPVSKTIRSAAANAINNFGMDENSLYISEIYANDGMRIKRFIPRAKGSASGLVKRCCHITVVVKMR